MIIIIGALIVVGIVLLERNWADYALRSLRLHSRPERSLVEPGQDVQWIATVENHSRLPIPFVRLVQDFPIEAKTIRSRTVPEERNVNIWYAEDRMSLGGGRGITRQIPIRFEERGLYHVGGYRLCAGDLLGFREEQVFGPRKQIVVMPDRSKQKVALDALGGFLGEMSVRRFILEDPILTMGFRDYSGREPMKDISWTRTAVTGNMQVKQYDHTAEQHVVVLLNTEGASADELEECFRLTRSVCEKLEQKKMPYSFRTNGNLPGPVGKVFHVPEGLGAQHLNTILYGLGCGDHLCYFSLRYLVSQICKKRRGNESYIVITPHRSPETMLAVHQLSNAVGGQICVLTANQEVRGL